MRNIPTFAQLPVSERICLLSSVLGAFAILGYFSFFANAANIISLLKFAGLGSLMLVLVITGFATIKVVLGNLQSLAVNGWWGWLRKHRVSLSVWFVCSVAAVTIFPKGNRILMDEIIVLSTSKAIHEEREPVTPGFLNLYGGVHKLSAAYVDKRPFLYATFVASLHDLLGYSPNNAFYVNMLLAVLTLALVGVVGSELGGGWEAGVVAMVALTSIPLFCEHATGGGIDISNLFGMTLLLFCCQRYSEQPSIWTARAMLGAGLIVAYARYESVLFLAMPMIALVAQFRKSGRTFVDWPVLCYMPALLPLLGIHYITFSRSAEAFQLSDAKVTAAFSLNYVYDNIGHAISFFFNAQHLFTNSAVVFVIGFASLLLLGVSSIRQIGRGQHPGVRVEFVVFSLVTLAGFGLLMAYSWGNLDEVVAARLSLPFYLLLVLCTAAICREFKNRWRNCCVLTLIFLTSLYWSEFPLAAKQYAFKVYTGAQRQAVFEEFNDNQPDRRFAVINGLTNYWLTRDVYAIAPGSLNGNPSFLMNMLKSGEFRRIYLIQTSILDPKTGSFNTGKSELLNLPLDLELLSEDLVTGSEKIKVSRILDSSIARLGALVPAEH